MVQGEKKGEGEAPDHALCFNWDQDNLASSKHEVAARTKKAPGQETLGRRGTRAPGPPLPGASLPPPLHTHLEGAIAFLLNCDSGGHFPWSPQPKAAPSKHPDSVREAPGGMEGGTKGV